MPRPTPASTQRAASSKRVAQPREHPNAPASLGCTQPCRAQGESGQSVWRPDAASSLKRTPIEPRNSPESPATATGTESCLRRRTATQYMCQSAASCRSQPPAGTLAHWHCGTSVPVTNTLSSENARSRTPASIPARRVPASQGKGPTTSGPRSALSARQSEPQDKQAARIEPRVKWPRQPECGVAT